MEKLKQQVRIARRRMAMQRFLRTLPWCCFATLLVAAILIGVDKYYPLGLKVWAWPAMAVAAGAVVAAGWVWLNRRSELAAALEIDLRFGLRERVSSAYALSDAERESPIGRALIEDASRRVDGLDVAEGFHLSLSRWALAPLVPAAVAFLVAVFLNPVSETATAVAETSQNKQVKTSTELLERKLAERAQEAREQGLKDLEGLLTKVEQGTKQIAKEENNSRQALVKMNDLAKELAQRREQLGGDRLKDQLDQLKNLARGPADKMASALKNGDLKAAAKELKALKDQLENNQLDENAKAELAKQLEQMEEKLRGMAERHRKLEDELKSQIAQKRAAGQSKEADELEKQLSKLSKQTPQMEQLERMAQKLGQCAQCAKSGDSKGAAQALSQLESQLDDLKQQLAEAELLDEALEQLADAKESLVCKQCNGQGCEACRGRFSDRFGDRLGRGRGQGDRPEEETATGFYDTKVKQQTGRGAATVVGQVDGPNVQGRVEQEIQTQFQAVRGRASDPLADTKLPRGYREHARKYFDTLREGEQPAAGGEKPKP